MKPRNLQLVFLSGILFFTFSCDQPVEKKQEITEIPKAEVVVIEEDPAEPEIIVVNECGNTSFDLMENITAAVDRLEGTPYSRELKNDCSGIFHRVLDSMRGECPNSVLPKISEARSSRGIAEWYFENGDLTIISDPSSQGDLIEEGMVMFYGHGDRKTPYDYETLTIDTLKVGGTGINHIAIVTEVKLDEDGVLQSYTIFHGRNPKYPASETESYRTYDNHPELPVYGNWKEPWLAVANVWAPKD